MTGIYEEVARLIAGGKGCVLATVVQATGSSPQRAGAKMLIRPGAPPLGTIGGGCVEARVIEEARLALTDALPRTVPFDLTSTDGGLVCGGHMVVFIEPLLPDPHLVILGAGHVGKALAAIASHAGFRVTVVDDREEFANSTHLPGAGTVMVNPFSNPLRGITVDESTFIIVATRGHDHDLEAVDAALRTPACYIGLVGSRRKRGIITGSLVDRGFFREEAGRVIVPVGIPIGSVLPGEIAVSILAQIISIRRKHHGRHGHSACSGALVEDGAAETAPADR